MDEHSLTGTKELIFDAFIEMTSALGYENVSIRDIAKKVGINSASIYYHFENKGEILQDAYEYYEMHQFDNRKSVDEMKAMLETENAEDIVRTFFYTFVTEDQKKYVRMILITKIIYMRLFQDPVANAMFLDANRDNAEFVTVSLRHAIDVGRVDPEFDIEVFADVLIGSMEVMGIKAFASPEYVVAQLDQEKRILSLLARLLSTSFLY